MVSHRLVFPLLVSSFLLCLLCSAFPFFAQAWDGVVLRVVDGDTLIVAPRSARQPDQAALSVRLYGIDAPELKQAGGQGAKAALERLLAPGDGVEIIPMGSDRYHRAVGLVLLDGVLVNLEQIRHGHARVYDTYCRARLCRQWKKAEHAFAAGTE